MTVSITYGHGYLQDCDEYTDYSKTESGISGTISEENPTVIQLEGTCNDAGDEYFYGANNDVNALSLSTTTYNTMITRWKTSASSNGLGAKVWVQYSDDSVTWIVGGTGGTVPEFSTRWNVTVDTASSGLTYKAIRFYADDYPDTVATGTHQVYYDFLLFCEGQFVFPHVMDKRGTGGVSFNMRNRYADIQIPGRVGDRSQYLGMESPLLILRGDMLAGETWGGNNVTYGEYLERIFHEAHNDLWQWVTLDDLAFKVTPRDFSIQQDASGMQRKWEATFRLEADTSGDEDAWTTLQWLGA